MAAVISTSTGNPFDGEWMGNVVYASNQLDSASTEKFKADFAYEMAQITATIVSAPTTNVENFKIEFADATSRSTAKVMQIIPNAQRTEFAYEMEQIRRKIIDNPNLNIEEAKAGFVDGIAQLTVKIITHVDSSTIDTEQKTTFLRNNADIESKTISKVNDTVADQKAILNTGYIDQETYTALIDELMHIGQRSNRSDNKVKFDGEIRYHYAFNSGSERWKRDSSGIRMYLRADAALNKDWRAYGILESKKNLVHYNNEFKLSRLYVVGKVGTSTVKAGSFGYLMAEGNIYDSGFDGIRVDFEGSVKYTLSYGETNDTKDTAIATARYEDFDYNLEAGMYHYQTDDSNQNTIWTLGGNYNFSNFSVGTMVLSSSLKDRNGNDNGYVLSLNYGDLKSWRAGTYEIFAKYYNQSRGTYIAHGMNGIGGSMQGFKGYGVGMNYALKENLVAGIEYYRLSDKISKDKGDTWWSQLTYYF
nr:S-layer protein [Pelosinus baikalensis]